MNRGIRIFSMFFVVLIFVFLLSEYSFSAIGSVEVETSDISDMDVIYLSDFMENGYSYGGFLLKPIIEDVDSIRVEAVSEDGRVHDIYDIGLSKGFGNLMVFDKETGFREFLIKDDIGVVSYLAGISTQQKKNYIVEFEDEPVYVMASDLDEDFSRNGVGSVSSLAAVSAYERRIASVHQTARADIKDMVKSSKSGGGAVVLREYSKIFNGMAISVDDEAIVDDIERLPYVRGVFEDKEVSAFLDDSVSMINATDVWAMDASGFNVTGRNVTIAIIDTGVDYTHVDLGGMGITTVYNGTRHDYALESDHPYDNYENETWTITMPGFSRIAVHFANISVENGFDGVLVYDSSDNLVKSYSGFYEDEWSPSVSGDTIKIRLTSDFSIVSYGFLVDEVIDGEVEEVVSGGSSSKFVGGWDFYNNDADFMDDNGHGTHVAATACGNGTLMGVAPGAQILAYKVLSSYGSGSSSNIIAAIERAVVDGADIISMSLGGTGDPDDVMSRAVDNAFDAGVVVVVSAGNSGPSYRTVSSPGTARNALTVGAVDKNGVIASFSSKGPVAWSNGTLVKPDVLAPGVSICAARATGTSLGSACVDSEHISISGTSMAAPHVAGVAALIIQAHPEWSPADVKSAIMMGSWDSGYDVATQGSGLIDALESYNTDVIVEYSNMSIDFSGASSDLLSRNVTVRNLLDERVRINLSVTEAGIGGEDQYDLAFVNVSYINVSAESNASFEFFANSSNISGVLFGKIKLSYGGRNHTLPYIVSKVSHINVYLDYGDIDPQTGDIYPFFCVYDDELDHNEFILADGSFARFEVPSNRNYTVCALDGFNDTMDYLLFDRVFVGSEDASVYMNISDATPFSVQGVGMDGRNINMYYWKIGFVSYIGTSVYPITSSITWYGFDFRGNRTVYISDKSPYGPDTDILLKYSGIPVGQ